MLYRTGHKSHITLLTTAAIALGACSGTAEKLSRIGKAPEQAKIENPNTSPEFRPVSMPMPKREPAERGPNSLWSSSDGRKGFFKDQRASEIGDILTVTIDIQDEAELENETETTRTSNENAQIPSFLGNEADLSQVLSEEIDPENLTQFGSNSTFTGEGELEREEEITFRLAATVTQSLPNGNLVVKGRQEVRVNHENRVLLVSGIIRPQDITVDNTIPYDQIAEARISYGGKGTIADVQQPRYGQQAYDILFPF